MLIMLRSEGLIEMGRVVGGGFGFIDASSRSCTELSRTDTSFWWW